MNPYEFSPEEEHALHTLAREKLREMNAPLWETLVLLIMALALMAAIAFSIITTIVVWSNMELFSANISG
jgi:hypothetical protein